MAIVRLLVGKSSFGSSLKNAKLCRFTLMAVELHTRSIWQTSAGTALSASAVTECDP